MSCRWPGLPQQDGPERSRLVKEMNVLTPLKHPQHQESPDLVGQDEHGGFRVSPVGDFSLFVVSEVWGQFGPWPVEPLSERFFM